MVLVYSHFPWHDARRPVRANICDDRSLTCGGKWTANPGAWQRKNAQTEMAKKIQEWKVPLQLAAVLLSFFLYFWHFASSSLISFFYARCMMITGRKKNSISNGMWVFRGEERDRICSLLSHIFKDMKTELLVNQIIMVSTSQSQCDYFYVKKNRLACGSNDLKYSFISESLRWL